MAARFPLRRSLLVLLTGVTLAAGTALLSGCGGGSLGSGDDHNVTIVLAVADEDGYAFGDVTVWVDGALQTFFTADEYVALGDGYPESWEGFLANWISDGFYVTTYGWDDEVDIRVQVSRSGYVTQETTFTITGDLPYDVFARETFIMVPRLAPATADKGEVQRKSKPGEVRPGTGLKPALTRYPVE